jgi:phage shock protein E
MHISPSNTVTYIDVRQPDEFNQSHLPGAINIPLGQISQIQTSHPDILKSDEIVTYCQSGSRAGMAVEGLGRLGFSKVTNGMSQGEISKNRL